MKRSPKRTLALIAHDGKKADMIAFVKDNLEFCKSFELVATATTGKLLQQTGLKVKKVLSGPIGGDAQIAIHDTRGLYCDSINASFRCG